MQSYKTTEPIFANITSIFGSAVIVVRLSSAEFEDIIKACLALEILPEKLKHKQVFLTKITKNGEFLDESLVTFFEAPHSFTGEFCLEIALHGSRFIFEELGKVLISTGFRFAENGEFSYRAFINGKMNLVEAEGMASLIASQTVVQHLAAKRQFCGENAIVFKYLRDLILEVLANIESLIDFSDEDLPTNVSKILEEKVLQVQNEIAKYLQNNSLINLKEGLKLAIIGRPNVGKSSIFNRLCGRERAIVSNIAGTTRDVLEESIILKGIPLIFYDTAGINSQTKDKIELEGIKRAVEVLEKSDIKLLVKEATQTETFTELAKQLNLTIDENTILVINKSDVGKTIAHKNEILISAKTGEGFEALIKRIEGLLEQNFLPLINTSIVASERQRTLLAQALTSLEKFNLTKEIELASEDLRIAAKNLEQIIGRIDIEDVLGNIFSKFCIGK